MIDAHVARLNGPHEVEFGVETLSTNPGPDEIVAETLKSAISVGTEIAAFEGIAPLPARTDLPPRRWLLQRRTRGSRPDPTLRRSLQETSS